MTWLAVAMLEDLPEGRGVRVESGEHRIAVFRVGDRVYAIGDRCSHAEASLSEGELFGTEIESSLLLVVYASFWQVLIQVLYGVQDVDPVADQTARSYRLGVWARIRYVVWPTALPYVMTGVRLAAAVALVLAITAELVIGAPGLGQRIGVAQSSSAAPLMYALVVVTGVLGVLVNLGARAAERRLLSWHQSVRGELIT